MRLMRLIEIVGGKGDGEVVEIDGEVPAVLGRYQKEDTPGDSPVVEYWLVIDPRGVKYRLIRRPQ